MSVPDGALLPARRLAPRTVLAWLATLAAVVLVALAVRHHADEVARTLRDAELLPILGATACHVLSLVLRSEAWRIGLRAVGADELPLGTIHRANGIAFLVGTAQGELSLPARVAALRKAEPERAPSALTTAMVDLPLALVEIACLFLIAALWQPVLLVGAVLIAVVLPVLARRVAPSRPEGSPLRGLLVAAQPAALGRLTVVMAGVVVVSAARIALILLAFDLPADIASVAKVVAAITVIGALPVGVGTGPAAAVASLSTGAGATATQAVALSAGLAISATSVLGVAVYALVVWAPVPLRFLSRGARGGTAG